MSLNHSSMCCVAWLLWALAARATVALAGEPFTVSDSIGLTRITDPDMLWVDLGLRQPEFKYSPDRSRAVIVTRRGNLETGRNEFILEGIPLADAARFVNGRDIKLPRRVQLAKFESSSVWPAIDALTWLPDSRRVAFIGRGVDRIGQIYSYDFAKRELRQLTRSAYDIPRFAISADENLLIYSALVPPDWKLRNKHGYTVESQFVASLAWTDPSQAVPEVRYFVENRSLGSRIPAGMEPMQYLDNVFISPFGDLAVTINYPRTIPAGWEGYGFINKKMAAAAQVGAVEGAPRVDVSGVMQRDWQNEAFGTRFDWIPQAMLVDTKTGESRLLLNSPLSPNIDSVRVRWSPLGGVLVIGPTYLPIAGMSTLEAARRQSVEALAEVDLKTGIVSRVTNVDAAVRVMRMEWETDGSLKVEYAKAAGGVLPPKLYRKSGGVWREGAMKRASLPALHLSVSQGMNAAPEIVARDIKSGKSRAITDLNPQLRDRTLGRVGTFDWTDRLGRQFQGGLVLPPNFHADRRYPIVIQGGGFNVNTFAIDGFAGFQGAYAAQALANSGLLVLQLPTRPLAAKEAPASGCTKWEDCGESPRWAAMVEGAVTSLEQRKLIKHDRIGIIGFSRVGMYVHHLLTFSTVPIAAATICDSISATPLTYSFVFGFSYPGMLEWESESGMGGPFWGEGIKLWQERSPAFHLDRITAPLRIEFISRGISAYWDTFANLKRHRRPVELVHIPLDIHPLQTPYGRYTSLQGNVDWFRFWLLDEEDLAPNKAEQYARWRRLRQQRDSVARSPAASRSGRAGATGGN